ncbi:carbohydrate binding domain-containing protein [Jeotgalibacillus proteolyticus]|uniref:carbohydrate binding domain-containing protein n=1 Tax=Jeotgalibacillus proteolyticus TaxID=2082395 RepID=UPI003CE8073F
MYKKMVSILLVFLLVLPFVPDDTEISEAKPKGHPLSKTTNLKQSTLKNQTILGDLIITPAAGKNITLENVKVLGKTYIRGKAPDTLELSDTTLRTLIVKTPSHSPLITVSGKSLVHEAFVNAQATLIESEITSKGFHNVTVHPASSKEGKVTLYGDFNTITTASDGNKNKKSQLELHGISERLILNALSNVTLTDEGVVKELEVTSKARHSAITGDGLIQKAKLQSPIEVNGEKTEDPDTFVTPWSLVWNDEFNNTEIDRSKWGFEIGNGFTDANGEFVSGWGNNEKQYYTDRPENAKTEDGQLVITAKEEEYEGFSYTSARLRTKGLFSKTYGKFEMKASLPTGKGYWPAFWMLPEDDLYGGWAASGEIDILEAKGSRPHEAIGTIHYGETWPNNKYTGAEYTFENGSTIADEHVYSVEWEPGEIRWYVDGILTQTQDNWYSKETNASANHTYPAPFDQPFHMLLNLAIGGNFDGDPTEDTMFPQSMNVEYVRVYDLTGRPYQTPELPVVEAEPLPEDAKLPLEDGNLIYNNGFDQEWDGVEGIDGVPNTDYWYFLTLPDFGGQAAVTIDSLDDRSFAKVDIQNGGNQPYAVQLIQDASIGKGRYYKVSFDAKSTNARDINVKISGDADRDYATYSNSQSYSLTDQVETYEMVFQMTEETDIAARLEFNLGLSTLPVWVGNVRIEETTPSEMDTDASKPALPDGNLVYNGTFDQGFPDRLLFWNRIDTEEAASIQVDPDSRVVNAQVLEETADAQDVQLIQKGIQLQEEQEYELTFDAKADIPREIKVELRSQDGNVTYSGQSIPLTTDWAANSMSFTMPEATDLDSQLIFHLGGKPVKMELDTISLKKVGGPVNPLPLENGGFDNGLEPWQSYIHFDAQASVQHTDSQAHILIDQEGQEPWSVQFFQDNLVLEPNKEYNLSFEAQSTVDRSMEVTIENAEYTRFLSETIELKENSTRYEFTVQTPTSDPVSLKFLLGKAGSPIGEHDIVIDNVELKQQ